MIAILTLIFGFVLGFIIHILTMKISFKQRTIDLKIKVYDSIISSWVKMRNEIFNLNNTNNIQFNQFYGESQTYIGEIFLVTEDTELASAINDFNEKFYRQNWGSLDLHSKNTTIENLKTEGLILISQMRKDIQVHIPPQIDQRFQSNSIKHSS